ncbi:threonine synthase [Solirubrum puertoriconensis]|uniref:Threonine synthase n=1 Tax=Solirubrum puertoriconensis TaxID=1751427 RepID=A0A9X0HHK9_SOLP1|nr:threonine synthase [Solirubrum puertoriconensis]KUG06029.1 threonine synthase [Solirubrum puertoriconensis]
MNLYSTNNRSLRVPFREALFQSMPADLGLYMPADIPRLPAYFLAQLAEYSFPEIAFVVARTLLHEAVPEEELRRIVNEAVSFPAPVVPLGPETFVLELFHGPSLAFKDFGARFMGRLMSYFLELEGDQVLDVLVATSGDTGGAVALGFLGVPNVRVTILYPKGKVSAIQELQLTTNGQNIRAVEVAGTFDDCQALVKQAFADAELNERMRLTSANSINIARLIPQAFYYVHAYAQLLRQGRSEVVFSVPSGNFGNLGAGLLAWKMGLPVQQFLAATNANDTVPRFLRTGQYAPKPSVATLSNAMDVGNPSNWARIAELFAADEARLRSLVHGYSFTDADTRTAIQQVYQTHRYVMCPHTAIAWLAWQQWRRENPAQQHVVGVFLATAHPCKFPEVFEGELAAAVLIPEQVRSLHERTLEKVELFNNFEALKNYLLSATAEVGS